MDSLTLFKTGFFLKVLGLEGGRGDTMQRDISVALFQTILVLSVLNLRVGTYLKP